MDEQPRKPWGIEDYYYYYSEADDKTLTPEQVKARLKEVRAALRNAKASYCSRWTVRQINRNATHHINHLKSLLPKPELTLQDKIADALAERARCVECVTLIKPHCRAWKLLAPNAPFKEGDILCGPCAERLVSRRLKHWRRRTYSIWKDVHFDNRRHSPW